MIPRAPDAGLPRIGRWSGEQRMEVKRRQEAVRWCYENAMCDLRSMQAQMSGKHNATLAFRAAGGKVRWWWEQRSSWVDYRTVRRPAPSHGYTLDDHRLPVPRPFAKSVAQAWIAREGTESVKAIGEATGVRADGRLALHHPARSRGYDRWSMSYLDSLFPDLTCRTPRTAEETQVTPQNRAA